MKRQSLHVKDNAIYDQLTKQQVIWTHGYGATDRYVTRNEWGALLLQWPVPGSSLSAPNPLLSGHGNTGALQIASNVNRIWHFGNC